MEQPEDIAYIPHLRHRHNCSVIESAKAGKPIQVLIVPDDDQRDEVAKVAEAVLEGDLFYIRMPDGIRWPFPYQDLLTLIEQHKPPA
jgi:hypothetical protein